MGSYLRKRGGGAVVVVWKGYNHCLRETEIDTAINQDQHEHNMRICVHVFNTVYSHQRWSMLGVGRAQHRQGGGVESEGHGLQERQRGGRCREQTRKEGFDSSALAFRSDGKRTSY